MPFGGLKANEIGVAPFRSSFSNTPSRSTEAANGPSETPNEAEISTASLAKLPPCGSSPRLISCSSNGPVGKVGIGRLARRPVPLVRRSLPAASASAATSRLIVMPSPRISFRKPSEGLNTALVLRATNLSDGVPFASCSATPSSPMLSVTPRASLPIVSALPVRVRPRPSV